jgi:hypothetical protein
MELLDIVIVLIDPHAHYMCTDYKYVPQIKNMVIFSVQFHLRLFKITLYTNTIQSNYKYSILKAVELKEFHNSSIF